MYPLLVKPICYYLKQPKVYNLTYIDKKLKIIFSNEIRISLEWIKEKLENEYYTGQESQNKKQKEMLKSKLEMKKN